MDLNNVDLAVDEDKRVDDDKLTESLTEACDETVKLPSALCEPQQDYAAAAETNAGYSNGMETIMDDEEGGANKLKEDSDEHGEAAQVPGAAVKALSLQSWETEVDCEEGGHPELKGDTNLLLSLSPLTEACDEAVKLPSALCEPQQDYAAAAETNAGYSNGMETVMDDEEGGANKLKEDSDEHGEGYIIGSLAGEGSQLLSLDLSMDSDVYHCFTIQEIKHVLKRKEPTTLCVPGVETLHKSSEVYQLITKKLKTSKGWRCQKTEIMLSLSEIDKELDVLKDRLLPSVIPKKGRTQSKGNTKCTTRVIKKANHISKLAKALKRKKKVTGEPIGSELCKMIKYDPPKYLKDHVPELIQMVKSAQDKPVWFYPSR